VLPPVKIVGSVVVTEYGSITVTFCDGVDSVFVPSVPVKTNAPVAWVGFGDEAVTANVAE
jgi:hypothetical protein